MKKEDKCVNCPLNQFYLANTERIMDELETKEVSDEIKLGMKVYHNNIYNGKELMEIIGIRKTEVELEGDYSGGTHNVCQISWMNRDGLIK